MALLSSCIQLMECSPRRWTRVVFRWMADLSLSGQPSAVWAQVDEVPHEVLCILAMTSASLLLSALSKMVDLGRVHASLNGEVFEGTWSWLKISRSLTSAAVEICIHHPSPDSLRKQIHWPPSSSKPAAWPSWMSPISLHCHSQHGRAGASGRGGQVHQARVHHKAYGGRPNLESLNAFSFLVPEGFCSPRFLLTIDRSFANRRASKGSTANPVKLDSPVSDLVMIAVAPKTLLGLEEGPGRPKGKRGQEPLICWLFASKSQQDVDGALGRHKLF